MVKNLTPHREYYAPRVDVLEVVSEQVFAGSANWNDSLDHELDWGSNTQFE